MDLKIINCYNCGSDKYDLYDQENGFNLVKCAQCGLLYVNPRPPEDHVSKAHLTGEHQGQKAINTTGKYRKWKTKRYKKILKDFFPEKELEKQSSDWFDIGCGFGEFLEALKSVSKNKIQVKGTELNKYKIDVARKRNLDVDSYDLEEMDQKFDFVSLLNVYSHLPDPVEFLSGLKKLLKPGGELFLETGHTAHLPPEDQYKPYYLPDHLSFANREILENILEKIGFEIKKVNIYRSHLYPKITDFREIIVESLKIVLNRNGNIRNFFPKHPYIDMYIRCKLKE